MQLPRVVIAAVFFIIGALIAIPALMNGSSEAQNSGATSTTSPSPSGSGKSPSRSASPSKSPSPTSTRTTRAPALPLRVTIGSVDCPGRTVDVTIRNTGTSTQDFAIETDDGAAALPGSVGSGATRSSQIKLREDRRTRIQITWKNEPVRAKTMTANCRGADASPSPTPTRTADDLPRTGPDDAGLWAKTATGGAAMLTGLIIFWYGGIWPRRRERVFAKGTDKNSG